LYDFSRPKEFLNGSIRYPLTGFGKEIQRLEYIHGYRYDPILKQMVPTNKSQGLPTLTKKKDPEVKLKVK
jgi:hypothetical protein